MTQKIGRRVLLDKRTLDDHILGLWLSPMRGCPRPRHDRRCVVLPCGLSLLVELTQRSIRYLISNQNWNWMAEAVLSRGASLFKLKDKLEWRPIGVGRPSAEVAILRTVRGPPS